MFSEWVLLLYESTQEGLFTENAFFWIAGGVKRLLDSFHVQT